MDWMTLIGPVVTAAVVAGLVSLVVALINRSALLTTNAEKLATDIDIAVRKLASDQQQANKQREEANKRPFLEKQLEICLAASDAASRLATELRPEEWETAKAEFLQLFWGQLAIVEDRKVEQRMVEFYEALKMLNGPAVVPEAGVGKPSLNLAYAVRNLIFESWNIKLPNLKGEEEVKPSEPTI